MQGAARLRVVRMTKRPQSRGIGSGNAPRIGVRPKSVHRPGPAADVRAKNIRVWGGNQNKENVLRAIVCGAQNSAMCVRPGPEKGMYDLFAFDPALPGACVGLQLKVRTAGGTRANSAQFGHLKHYPDGTLLLLMVHLRDGSCSLWWRWSHEIRSWITPSGKYQVNRGGHRDFQSFHGIDDIKEQLPPLLKSALATAVAKGHAKSEQEIMTAISCKTQLMEYKALQLMRKEYKDSGILLVDPDSEGLPYDQIRISNDQKETIQFKVVGKVGPGRHLAPYKASYHKMGGKVGGKSTHAPYSEEDHDVAIFKLVEEGVLRGWWEVTTKELTSMGLTAEGGHRGGSTIYLFNRQVEGKAPNSFWYEPSLRWWRPARNQD